MGSTPSNERKVEVYPHRNWARVLLRCNLQMSRLKLVRVLITYDQRAIVNDKEAG